MMKRMARCKYCRMSGLFSTVSKSGICGECFDTLKMNFRVIIPVIQELIELSEKSSENEIKIRHLDLAIQHTTDLMVYDHQGIFDLSDHVAELESRKQNLVYSNAIS